MKLQIVTIESAPFAENSYLVWRDGSTEAVVVDPGFEPDRILDAIAERQLQLVAIINTHGHVDHIAGNAELKQAFPAAPIVIGRGDAIMLTDASANLSATFGWPIVSPPADRTLVENDLLEYAGMSLLVKDLPGHSPGHIILLAPTEPPTVFGGDVLFRGSIGRTDFPGGSLPTLLQGIRQHLYPLPAETLIYPGHGPVTTIGHERTSNPFLTNA